MKLELQATGRAYSGDIPESAWHTISVHRKVSTADKTLADAREEMRDRCGAGAWDSHYRLVNAGRLPVQLTALYLCLGPTHVREYCGLEQEVAWYWQPGTAKPRAPQPDGWWSAVQCGECRAKDAEWEGRL